MSRVAAARNHVHAALDDVRSGRPVKDPSTEPYGFGVKYAD